MTERKDKTKKQIIYFLKKNFSMEATKSIRFDLKEYSIIKKGAFLKNIYTWRLTNFNFETYFLSIRNSYKVEVSGTSLESLVTMDVESLQNAVIIKTDFDIPDLMIRPADLKEKIANLFLKFDIKLENRNSFNNKYILESLTNQLTLENILTKKLTNELIKYNEFSLEFKSNIILLKFEKEFNQQDSVALIRIAKLIETELKP